MNINFEPMFMLEVFPRILKYVYVTLGIAVISMFIGLCIGTLIALIRIYKIKGLNSFMKVYISFFRGTPLLVQLFLLYYGLPQVIPKLAEMNAYTAAFIGLSLNSGAYMSEIIRGAIGAIDKGQMEACLSVGMTSWQGMKRVILPQAARVAIPALGNTFISLLKESSLAFTLGVSEMLAQAKMAAAATYRVFESYLVVALMYWMITIVFSYIQGKIEEKLSKAY
ncbi:amino acid ABC transporter permease [Paramaledivibacter caminithermalis]|uniref:Amino acid ABC transporter membrane protein, PAAT family (TC 3.A.1.3.-) n=1 Tax=Paramaledivibacter caminithermalis (strain DSM 15212 / CIP 107654 / DViRD3) TaxID=1121301 RepID=A0A1M6M585_PARC5|nr:amino acid ABC transporter permease [Paramaledivibacter caminithermalis]SHJ78644.1 amino acid ABC transporter membrane protein, PAAT family (TC 3.A.1.3.-) [Paramaledivibacter caminithermalis DSM 15212]